MHFAARYASKYVIKPWVTQEKQKQGYTIELTLRVALARHVNFGEAVVGPVLQREVNRYLGGRFKINGHPVDIAWRLSWQKAYQETPSVLMVYLLSAEILKKHGAAAGVHFRYTCGSGEDRDTCVNIILPDNMFHRRTSRVSKDTFGRVAAHEIGHSLGLRHSGDEENVMFERVKDLNQRISDSDIGQIVRTIIPQQDQPAWLKFGASLPAEQPSSGKPGRQ